MKQRYMGWVTLFVAATVVMIGVMITLIVLEDPHRSSSGLFAVFVITVASWLAIYAWGCGLLIRGLWQNRLNRDDEE